MGIQMDEQYLTTLLFTDDQIIIASDEHDTDYIFRKLEEWCETWGLTIRVAKTEYLKVGDIYPTKKWTEFK